MKNSKIWCVIALISIVDCGATTKLGALSSCKKSSGLAYIHTSTGSGIFSSAFHCTGTARRRNIARQPRFSSSRIHVGSFVTRDEISAVHSIFLTAIPLGSLSNAEPQWNESQRVPFFPLSRLIHLNEALKIAVSEERYEAASAIRDEIRALRSQDEITRLRLLLDDSVAGMHTRHQHQDERCCSCCSCFSCCSSS